MDVDRKDNTKRGRHESPASEVDRSTKNPRLDSFEALDATVREKVRALFDRGLVREDELDDSILRRLAEIDPKEALECLEQFSQCDLSRVRNKSAYIVGVMRRMRNPAESQGGGSSVRSPVLHESIQMKLKSLIEDGVIKPNDIDQKCMDKLAQLSAPCAMEALTQLANRDLTEIRSIARFLMSIINRLEHRFNMEEQRTVHASLQIPPLANIGLVAPPSMEYPAMNQTVAHAIYPGLYPHFVNGKRNFAVEQLKMGVRVDEFHALSPHAPNIHPAIALKLQDLWDSGVKLVAILDDRVWSTLASMRAPEALICIEEMANQLSRVKNPNAYFMSMVRQYEGHGLNTGREHARIAPRSTEVCEEFSQLSSEVKTKIDEVVQAQAPYLRTADFDRGVCYALMKVDVSLALNLLGQLAEQPLENVKNMSAFIMSFIRRRQP